MGFELALYKTGPTAGGIFWRGIRSLLMSKRLVKLRLQLWK